MKRSLHLTSRWSVALLAVASAACVNKDDRTASANDSSRADSSMTASLPESTASTATASGVNSPLTDESIAWTLMNANSTDSALGAQAKRMAKGADVRAFGEHMVQDHGKNNQELREMLKQQSITPRAGADSAMHAKDAANTRSQLDTTKAFDAAYISRVTEMHRDLLQKLDSTMISQAKNTALKSHLQKTRPHVAEHLKRAEELQAKLPRSANQPGT